DDRVDPGRTARLRVELVLAQGLLTGDGHARTEHAAALHELHRDRLAAREEAALHTLLQRLARRRREDRRSIHREGRFAEAEIALEERPRPALDGEAESDREAL